MKALLLLSAVLASALNAQAQSRTVEQVLTRITPGNYNEQYWAVPANGPDFEIRRQGSRVSFIDRKLNISYNLDVSNPGQQSMPTRFLESIRQRPATSSAGSIIKNISVGNVRLGSKPDQLIGTAVVELEYSSPFGSLSATLEMDASVQVKQKRLYTYYKGKSGNVLATELDTYVGQSMRLTKFSTSLSQFDNLIGLIVDTALRIGSLGLQQNKVVTEIRVP